MSVLLATDFDGTIAPIVREPAAAQMHPAARSFLARLAGDRDVVVAIISGRDVEDMRPRLRGVRAFVAGSHGLECEDPDRRVLWTCSRAFPQPEPALLAQLQRAGMRVERKKFSLAVHFRGLDPTGVTGTLDPFVAWARGEGLSVIPGRMIVEARVPGGGKHAALRTIAEHVDAERVLYAGDDTTDFEALAFAASCGRAAFVVSAERAAPDVHGLVQVRSVRDLVSFFERELSARREASVQSVSLW